MIPAAGNADIARTLAAGMNRDMNRQVNHEVDWLDPSELAQRCSTLQRT